MQIINDTLVLNKQDLKQVLIKIALSVENISAKGLDVAKIDLIELFKDEIDILKFINNLDYIEHNKIEISL